MTTTNAHDAQYRTVGADAHDLTGFSAVELDDGDLIVYDIDGEEGWIQSSDWIGLEFMI